MRSDSAQPDIRRFFAILSAVQLSAAALARLREWIASIAHAAECIAYIEYAAVWRPCPRPRCLARPAADLSAIIEADETYKLEFQKGSRSLTRRPRSAAAWQLHRCLKPVLPIDVLLISDGAVAIDTSLPRLHHA
jgi:hypothetical protein